MHIDHYLLYLGPQFHEKKKVNQNHSDLRHGNDYPHKNTKKREDSIQFQGQVTDYFMCGGQGTKILE